MSTPIISENQSERTNMERALNWAIANRIRLLAFTGVILGVVLIGSVFVLKKRETQDLNWTRLSQAQQLLAAFTTDKDKESATKHLTQAKEMFAQIKNETSGSYLSNYAQYYLGESNLLEKNFDAAIKNFSEVELQTTNSNLRPLAICNLAFSYEESGNYPKAVGTYQEFMTKYSDHFLAARIQSLLGQAQMKAGDIDGAKKTLGNLIDLYPTSSWAENSRRLLDKNQTR